jgi:hypothetical protein
MDLGPCGEAPQTDGTPGVPERKVDWQKIGAGIIQSVGELGRYRTSTVTTQITSAICWARALMQNADDRLSPLRTEYEMLVRF